MPNRVASRSVVPGSARRDRRRLEPRALPRARPFELVFGGSDGMVEIDGASRRTVEAREGCALSKRRGHFCWCCGQLQANERFSGHGHAHHVCKDCHKLGAQELEYRQAIRNIDRMVQWETGRIKRKQRANFDRFLRHPNERVRRYAEDIAAGRVGAGPGADAHGADSGNESVGMDSDDEFAESQEE